MARLKAVSTNPDSPLVNYVIQPGDSAEQNGPPRSFYQRVDERSNEMLVVTYKPLDYETLPHYTLTIKAAVSDTFVHLYGVNTGTKVYMFQSDKT